MTILELVIWLVAGYVVLILLIERVVWRFQPPMEGALTLVVNPDQDSRYERRLDSFERQGVLHVSSNHWFRSWYRAVLANPQVDMIRAGTTHRYSAVAVSGGEHKNLLSAYKMGFVLRLLCGFAPSKFLRLVPSSESPVAPE